MTKPRKPQAKIGRPKLDRARITISVAKETLPPLTKLAKRYGGHKGVAVDELVRNAPAL